MTLAIIVLSAIVSLTGCAMLTLCPPRPRAQEFWGIVALAPVFLVLAIIVVSLPR